MSLSSASVCQVDGSDAGRVPDAELQVRALDGEAVGERARRRDVQAGGGLGRDRRSRCH